MSYYCQQAEKNKSNRKLIKDLLDDLHCVLDKSFEESDRVQGDCGNLFNEVERYKDEVECYSRLKEQLEGRIQDLENQLQQLQACLEEQCQAREVLENIANQLKEQLAGQEECINGLTVERTNLVEMGRRMEGEMDGLRTQIVGLESDRDNLAKGVRGFEMSRNRCGELHQALAECCEKCDCLQKENYELRQQVRDLEGNLDTSCYEKNKFIGDMESIKQKFQEEKDATEAKLCQVLEEKAALEQKRLDICRKMTETTAAHHEEMDKLKSEADNYQNLYESEKTTREDVEQRLRDCLAGRQVDISSIPAATTGLTSSTPIKGPLPNDQCAELRRQLGIANEKAQKFQSMYEKESTERKGLEKRLLQCEKEKQQLETRVQVSGRNSPE